MNETVEKFNKKINSFFNAIQMYILNNILFIILFILCLIIAYYLFVMFTILPENNDNFKISTLQTLMLLLGNLVIIGGSLWLNLIVETERRKTKHLNLIKDEILRPWLEYGIILDDMPFRRSLVYYVPNNKKLYLDTKIHFPMIFEICDQLKILKDAKDKEDIDEFFPNFNCDNMYCISNGKFQINESSFNKFKLEHHNEIDKLEQYLKSKKLEFEEKITKINELEEKLENEINDALVIEKLPNQCQYI